MQNHGIKLSVIMPCRDEENTVGKCVDEARDFHCGIRAIRRESLQQLDLRTGGMEFATEMIARSSKAGLRIAQTPVSLKKCPETRKSKLRTVRDGLRHLAFILFH